jgi:hypothetical protein
MRWDYLSKWFGCEEQFEWWFPNGTTVLARDEETARAKINNYKLSQDLKTVYQTEPGVWSVQFDDNISMKVRGRTYADAITAASWRFYLDKRETNEFRIPLAHSQT